MNDDDADDDADAGADAGADADADPDVDDNDNEHCLAEGRPDSRKLCMGKRKTR